MVTREEVKFLKERALNFLDNARDLIKKNVWDIAAFNIEQFCQLYLKHKLCLLLGDFPKTHSLKILLGEVGKIIKKGEIKKFVESNASVIGNLENAYLTSRYLPIRFSKEEVEQMLGFAEKFRRFVDGL